MNDACVSRPIPTMHSPGSMPSAPRRRCGRGGWTRASSPLRRSPERGRWTNSAPWRTPRTTRPRRRCHAVACSVESPRSSRTMSTWRVCPPASARRPSLRGRSSARRRRRNNFWLRASRSSGSRRCRSSGSPRVPSSPAVGRRRAIRGTSAARWADRPVGPRRWSPRAWSPSATAMTVVAVSASPPPAPAWWGSSPLGAGWRIRPGCDSCPSTWSPRES
ncbi:hypothetical protein TPAU25S_02270 [Tsukamurella paurometabola]